MRNIYSIVIIDIVREREIKLSNLLGEEVLNSEPKFYITKNYNIMSCFATNARTFKTVKGALAEAQKLNTRFAGRQLAFEYLSMIDGVYARYFLFDTSRYSFSYVEVTDKWNDIINKDIEKENLRHLKEMVKLNKKLV